MDLLQFDSTRSNITSIMGGGPTVIEGKFVDKVEGKDKGGSGVVLNSDDKDSFQKFLDGFVSVLSINPRLFSDWPESPPSTLMDIRPMTEEEWQDHIYYSALAGDYGK